MDEYLVLFFGILLGIYFINLINLLYAIQRDIREIREYLEEKEEMNPEYAEDSDLYEVKE